VKVALIIPPSPFLLDERVFPSLGILRVAASLEQAGHHVDLLDLSGVSNYLEVVSRYCWTHIVDAFGITSTTPQFPSVVKIMRTLREFSTARIILGGPHVTLTNAADKMERKRGISGRGRLALESMTTLYDDRVLVAGDGEIAIHHALRTDACGIIDADDLNSEMFMSDEFYDATPEPARHLIDMRSYHYTVEGKEASSLISQLGCPFGCGFCGGRSSRTFRVTRTRTTEKIVSELRHMYEAYGYTGFMCYDDELNVSPAMVELMNAITDLQMELGVEFRLRGFIKAELFTSVQAEAMRRAGFRWILTGFEGAHPRILENINKKATVDDNTRCVETAKDAGLKVKALMSIGHPGESEETVRSVEDWLIKMEPDDFDCTVITTYPGTPYYDMAEHVKYDIWAYKAKSGDVLYSYDLDYATTADYYKGMPGKYKAYVFTDYLTSEDLVRLRDDLEKSVRAKLNIPFNPSRASVQFEHSMGQGIPGWILRTTETQ
jgi:radical SAM superfamily enzyme YgiQ (UPF0313 family)